MRTLLASAGILFAARGGFCQTAQKEPDALQSLLQEVHQLRLDIGALTVASQRVQIALYALQMQDAAVARSSQRFDDARNNCAVADENRRHTASEVQRLESATSAGTAAPESNSKDFQAALTQMKGVLESQTAEVQNCRAAEAEASSRLRDDRAKLSELQDRIERLDRSLEKLGNPGK
jgi:chromosome segregation ATPase